MKKLIALIMFTCFIVAGFAQQPAPKVNADVKADSLVQKFYAINHDQLYWFSSNKNMKRAAEWLTTIESAVSFGLMPDKQQIDKIRAELLSTNTKDMVRKERTDKQITALVLNFIKELQEGFVTFDYDEVTVPQDLVYINLLRNSGNRGSVSKLVSKLDCKDHDYLVMKKYLKDSINNADSVKYKKIALAMNYPRYLSVNKQPEYIVANIPETEVRYYRNNQLVLKMKSVVGKKKNPTPTIASYITDIVTFPFWNVPFSIASKELLPKVQKDESYLERNNFEVVDGKGNIVDDPDLNWAEYTEKNFPYFFRESTGPNNSLGVLKFNLGNPFSIYLHDTNSKGGFAKDYRFLSHGCVRLEKPAELAALLAGDDIDIQALKSGKKDTESKIIKLVQKIPVFIVYMPVTVDGKKVTFIKDVYGLIQ
jgi:murein L,D-transpeptidase YcbB/YkuD